MLVLIDHALPFFLAHGGEQVQILNTRKALEGLGVRVDLARWWDDGQRGDLLHYFGRPAPEYVRLAHRKNLKVVVSDQHGALAARPAGLRAIQAALMRLAEATLPRAFTERLAWDSFRLADACIGLTPRDGELLRRMFGADPARVHVVPNGVDEVFLSSRPVPRGPALLSVATIVPLKRILETAQAAVMAGVPYRVVGKPVSPDDAYFRRFQDFARAHSDLIRYEGPIDDRAALAAAFREARGFVLLSSEESFCLAAREAAACGCPLLLGDLQSLRSQYGDSAQYVRGSGSPETLAARLRAFHDAAPALRPPPRPESWSDVARKLESIYKALMETPEPVSATT